MKSAKLKAIAQNLKFSTERKSFEFLIMVFRFSFLAFSCIMITKYCI